MQAQDIYSFQIKYCGKDFICDVKNNNVELMGFGWFNDELYKSVKQYIEREGFVKAFDRDNGILDLL